MNGLAKPVGGSLGECSPYSSTLTQKLEAKKGRLEKRLNDINSALNVLKKNPEIKTLLDIVSKVY